MKKYLVLIFIFLFVHVFVCGEVRYVSGSDPMGVGNGTEGSPFRTLARAIEFIRMQPALTENLVILIDGGEYFVDETILLTEAESGNNGSRVIFRNWHTDDLPIFTGGERISTWSSDTGARYVAGVASSGFDVMYENNRRAVKRDSINKVLLPGDFFYSASGLYYIPYDLDSPINDQDIFIPVVDTLLKLQGGGTKIRDITFEGIIFSVTGSGSIGDDALISVTNGSGIIFSGCKMINSGGTAILLNGSADNIHIENCRIDGFLGSGILLTGSAAGVDNNRQNYINNNAIINGTGEGFLIFQSGLNKIYCNDISFINGTGIRITGDDTVFNATSGNKIFTNNIHSITAVTVKSGGIYAADTGLGNVVENNRIFNLGNQNPDYGISGIYLDAGGNDFLIEKNMIYGIHDDATGEASPLFIRGNNNKIVNNVIADNDPYHDVVYDVIYDILNDVSTARDITLARNIFYTPSGYYYHYFMNESFLEFKECDNNLIFHPGGEYYIKRPGPPFFYLWQNQYERNSIIDEDPLFTESGSGLFTVDLTDQSSPARNLADFKNINRQKTGVSTDLSTGLSPGFPVGFPMDFPFSQPNDRLEAEKYDSLSGIEVSDTFIRFDSDSEYAIYKSLLFNEDYHQVLLSYSMAEEARHSGPEYLEFRLGGVSGTLLGSVELGESGGLSMYTTVEFDVNTERGLQDLYVTYKSSENRAVQVDWFRFIRDDEPETPEINQPPLVEIISLKNNGEYTSGIDLNIQVSAFDPDGFINSLELYISDIPDRPNTPVDSSTGSEINYLFMSPVPGSYTVWARARDNEGTVTEIRMEINFTEMVSSSVQIQITSPGNNAVLPNLSEIDILTSVIDNKSEIFMVEFYFDHSLLFVDTGAPYEYTWKNVQSGEYNIEVRALNTDRRILKNDRVKIMVDYGYEDDIIAHWTLDEISGNTALDRSGHGNNGITYNTIPTDGIKEGAYDFDGTAAVVTNRQLLNALRQFTITAWIRPREFKEMRGLFGQQGVVAFGFNGEHVLHFQTAKGGVMNFHYPYETDEWHHVAAMGDGKSLKVYIDGSLIKRFPFNTRTYGSSGSSFNIGGQGIYDSRGNFFNGMIDDVYIFNKAVVDRKIEIMVDRPSIKIISPKPQQEIVGPANINILVETSASRNIVVEYYVNDEKLGESDTPPHYMYEWSGVMPKTYTLEARAVYKDNAYTKDVAIFSVIYPGEQLLAHWSFDEGSDTIAYDSSPRENHGVIENGEVVPGVVGSALHLSGNGSVISTVGLINLLTEFTLAGWIKPTRGGDRKGFWGQDDIVEFGFIRKTTIQMWIDNSHILEAYYPFPMEEWHHIAAVGDRSGLYLYFDGKLVKQIRSTLNGFGESEWTFNIGGGGIFDTHGNFFDGSMDEIYVYNKALHEEELAALANPYISDRPEIRILSPEEGAVVGFPGSVKIVAKGSESECEVNSVDFIIDDVKVFTDEEAPFEYEWIIDETYEAAEIVLSVKGSTSCGLWNTDAVTIRLEPSDILEEEDPGKDFDYDENPEDGEYEGFSISGDNLKKDGPGGNPIRGTLNGENSDGNFVGEAYHSSTESEIAAYNRSLNRTRTEKNNNPGNGKNTIFINDNSPWKTPLQDYSGPGDDGENSFRSGNRTNSSVDNRENLDEMNRAAVEKNTVKEAEKTGLTLGLIIFGAIALIISLGVIIHKRLLR